MKDFLAFVYAMTLVVVLIVVLGYLYLSQTEGRRNEALQVGEVGTTQQQTR